MLRNATRNPQAFERQTIDCLRSELISQFQVFGSGI